MPSRTRRGGLSIELLEQRLLLDALPQRLMIPEDWSEQDDVPQDATFLGVLTGHGHVFTGLTMDDSANEPTRQDWLAFRTTRMGTAGDGVGISFVSDDGDLDLALYDQFGFLVGYSQGQGDSEFVSLAGLPASFYYAVVFGYQGATNPDYTLEIDAPGQVAAIPEDYAEQNDSRLEVYVVPVDPGADNVLEGLTMDNSASESDREDWFQFETLGPGAPGDYVAIDFSHAEGDLDLYLYDAAGSELRVSEGYGDREWVSLQGLPIGTYYILVHGFDGAVSSDYTLTISTPFEVGGAIAEDAYEQNDSMGAAADLGAVAGHGLQWTGLTMDNSVNEPAAEDWYRFTTAGAGVWGDRVRISFVHAEGDLDLALYNASGAPLAVSDGTGNTETVSLSGLPAGTYYIEVSGYNGAVNRDYTLSIDAPVAVAGADSFEPNDSFAAARVLGTLSGPGHQWGNLSIHAPGNDDWYAFTLPADGGAGDRVGIRFADALGDLDMAVYDSDGYLIGYSDNTGDEESVSLQGLIAGTYYVQVYGYQNATNPRYDLLIDAPVDASTPAQIPEDMAEQNDTRGTAFNLRTPQGRFTLDGLTMDNSAQEPERVDWFSFSLASAGVQGNFVAISFSHAQGDLDMELTSADGTSIASSTSTGDEERLSLAGLAAGQYYVRVYGYNGAVNPSYSLVIDAPYAGGGIPLDAAEPNDTRQTAYNLRTLAGPGNTTANLTLHQAGQEDWYRFETAAVGTSSDRVRIEFSNQAGNLDLALYDSAGNLIGQSQTAGDGESITLQGRPAGVYYARITGAGGTATSPQYSLIVDAPTPATVGRNWTILVYMDADNNLEGAGVADLNEMEAVALPANVTVLVQMDRTSGYDSTNGNWTDTRRGIVTRDSNTNTISSPLSSVGEKNMGAGATLSEFISTGVQTWPAQHYALVLWDHGGGLSGVCWDDTNGEDNLSVAELTQAVAATGVHFDMIGFDTCLAGLTEQVYELRSLADVVVGSEETEPGEGWDYTAWLSQLAANPSMTAQQLGAAAVTTYGAFYGNRETQAATATSAYAGLLSALNTFSDAVVTGASSTNWDQIIAARNAAPSFTYAYLRDLGAFMSRVASGVTNAAISSAAAAVRTALNGGVLANHSGTGNGGTGLSIYLPGPGDAIRSEYTAAGYDFVADSRWLNFLNALTARGGRSYNAGDWAERNNARSEAYDLHLVTGGSNTWTNLSIGSGGDQDWFRFDLGAAGGSGNAVSISFSNAAENLDLFLYDASGALLASSATSGNGEQVSLAGRPAGRYYVRVAGAADTVANDYSLSIDAPSTGAIPEDWAERNDTRAQAYDLGSVPREGFRFTGFTMDGSPNEPVREDWFTVALNRGTDLNPNRVSVTFDNDAGNLDLYVYCMDGDQLREIGSSVTDADTETVDTPVLNDRLYVLVKGRTDSVTNPAYSLVFSRQDTGAEPQTLTLGDGHPLLLNYREPDGTLASVRLTGGSAIISFNETDWTATETRSAITINGDVTLASLDLAGTTSANTLTISGRPASRGADATVDVGRIGGSSPLRMLNAATARLVGAGIVMTGGGFIDTVKIAGAANGADIILPGVGSGNGLTLQATFLGAGTDVVLDNAGLKAMNLAGWLGSALRARWAGKITATGGEGFGADVVLTGPAPTGGVLLANLSTKGPLSGEWQVAGAVGTVTAAAIADTWDAHVQGGIASLTSGGDAAGRLAALNVGSLTVKRDMSTDITLAQGVAAKLLALGKLSVAGWIQDAEIRAAGSLGTITAGGIRHSLLYAGVKAEVAGLPATADDLSAQAAIASLTVRGLRGEPFSVIDADIAASALGRISLVNVRYDNGGEPFGLACETLARLTVKAPGETYVWPNREDPWPGPQGDARVIRLD